MNENISSLVIYNASAGSGKTTTLIREILKIIIGNESADEKKIRSILGMTFTNAVANELKKRLIEVLYNSISNPQKFEVYKNVYFKDLNLDDNILKDRCRKALQHILHHYSDLSLLTIDSFSNRVLRSFAYELQYPIAYEIAPEQNEYLNKIIEDYISNIDENEVKTIVEFIKAQKEEDTFNIKILKENLFELFDALIQKDLDENAIAHLQEKIKTINIKQLRDIYFKHREYHKKVIEKTNDKIRNHLVEFGQKHNLFFVQNNELIQISDDLSKKRFPTINKIYKGNSYKTLNELSEGEFFKKNTPDKEKLEDELKSIYWDFEKDINYIAEYDKKLNLLKFFNDQISITRVVVDLYKNLLEFKKEEGVVFFSDFTREISKVIQNESNVDFIFERVGTRYRHFLIDEFQDTSTTQFHNLLPLIHNAMAEGNINFIVGDPKQSIYRWRNANVKQFVDLYYNKDISLERLKSDWEKFKPNINTQTLNSNYRSAKDIVEFNNLIFNGLTFKDIAIVEQVYKSSAQISNKKESGYVEVIEYNAELLTNTELRFNEFVKDATIKIYECLNNYRFSQKDICVLLRTNFEIKDFIKLFYSLKYENLNETIKSQIDKNTFINFQKSIQFISPEGLLIYLSKDIDFIVSFLKLLVHPNNTLANAVCWDYIKNDNFKDSKLYSKDFLSTEIKTHFSIHHTAKIDLYQLCLDIIDYFRVPFNIYVQKFLSVVSSFIYQNAHQSNTIDAFLKFWEENKTKISISIDKNIDAIKLMTIHKSKGLEFPIVITYLDFANQPGHYWYQIPNDYELILSYKDDTDEINDSIKDFQGIYFYMRSKCPLKQNLLASINDIDSKLADALEAEEELENINLIYVAFTRPIKRMYVFTSTGNPYYISFIRNKIHSFIQNNVSNEIKSIYTYGDKKTSNTSSTEEKQDDDKIDIHSLQLKYNPQILIANNANPYSDKQKLGIKIHSILALLKESLDIEWGIKKAIAKGLIKPEEENQIQHLLLPLQKNTELQSIFDKNNIDYILNEIDIFGSIDNSDNNKSLHRPDKIIFTKTNEVIVLEFKTGEELNKYKQQIQTYIHILKKIYEEKKVYGYLIYLNYQDLQVIKVE